MKTIHHIIIGSGSLSLESDQGRFCISSVDPTGHRVELQSSNREELERMARVIRAPLEFSGVAGPGV